MLFHAVSCLCHCEYKNKSLGPGCLKPVHRGKAQTSTSTILNFFAGRIGPPFAPNIWNHPKIHFWHRQGNIRTSTDWCSSSISNSNSVWPIQHPQHRLCTVYIVFKTISGFYPIFFRSKSNRFLVLGYFSEWNSQDFLDTTFSATRFGEEGDLSIWGWIWTWQFSQLYRKLSICCMFAWHICVNMKHT